MNKNIKYIIEHEFSNNIKLFEKFQSSTISGFYKKIADTINSVKNKNNLRFIVVSSIYNNYWNIENIENFKTIASNLGLGKFKEEYLWKGNSKYQNETGIYNQEEVCKNLNISDLTKVSWKGSNNSLLSYCKKIPTCFIGLIENNSGNIGKIYFGMFINPNKGKELFDYWKTHNQEKEKRTENKQDNSKVSFENWLKLDNDIQNYFKKSSKTQQQLLFKFVNWSQSKNNKYLSYYVSWWRNDKELNTLINNFKEEKSPQEKDLIFKRSRYNVIKLMVQNNEKEVLNSNLFKNVDDKSQQLIQDVYKQLHTDLKKLNDKDIKEIDKKMQTDTFNIISNKR